MRLAAPGFSCRTQNLQSLLQHAGERLAVHVGSSSLTRGQALAPCIASLES